MRVTRKEKNEGKKGGNESASGGGRAAELSNGGGREKVEGGREVKSKSEKDTHTPFVCTAAFVPGLRTHIHCAPPWLRISLISIAH